VPHHPKNAVRRFYLSLLKAFTRHCGTKMIMEIMEDVKSYEKDKSACFKIF
jgi:hypothetical protein